MLIHQLDRHQRELAESHADAGYEHVVRFVVTYNRAHGGNRVLAHAQHGCCTYATPEQAQAWISAAQAANTPEQLRSVYGDVDTFQVRAAACWVDHHDPMGCWFDDDGENPALAVAGVAFGVWSKLDASERHGVSFGLFPAQPMVEADARLSWLDDHGRLLAVALMEIAAHTPKGVSLAGLSKVQRAKGRYGSGRSGVRKALHPEASSEDEL